MTEGSHKSIQNQDSVFKKRSLFGRRQGRAIKGERAEAMETILPEIEISLDQLPENNSVQPAAFFNRDFSSYWFEIGFGHGERLIQLFENDPDTAFIGAEPFINGMADFLKNIPDNITLDNIRVLMDDGMFIARSISPESLDGIYVLNPDPWHKKRHHKRRIINQTNLDIFAKILKPGAPLIMTSDVEDLAEWMCTQASNHPEFDWNAQCRDDWALMPKDWIPTRYEIKGAKGAKKMVYLFFTKKAA